MIVHGEIFQSKLFFEKSNDNEKPKKKYEEWELGKNRWYSQMGQIGTGLSIWDRWDWDRGFSRLGGTGWDWDRGVLRLGGTGWDWDKGVLRLGGTGWDWDRWVFKPNQSTCPKVGLVVVVFGLHGRLDAWMRRVRLTQACMLRPCKVASIPRES